MAIARSLRSTGITPLQRYKETALRRHCVRWPKCLGSNQFIDFDAKAFHFTVGRQSRWRTTTKKQPCAGTAFAGLSVWAAINLSTSMPKRFISLWVGKAGGELLLQRNSLA